MKRSHTRLPCMCLLDMTGSYSFGMSYCTVSDFCSQNISYNTKSIISKEREKKPGYERLGTRRACDAMMSHHPFYGLILRFPACYILTELKKKLGRRVGSTRVTRKEPALHDYEAYRDQTVYEQRPKLIRATRRYIGIARSKPPRNGSAHILLSILAPTRVNSARGYHWR